MLTVLLVILSGLAYFCYASYQRLVVKKLEDSATNAGEIILGSPQHAMLTVDSSVVQQIVDDIGT